ncbi:MAG: hypothetical protein CME63_03940 [Halobacteriovoraceae bacterium]|nr:hypothetical protein [Halobacteriovoraceae bacterium]MBC96875.1 hypothetical protein [Halobacteriovoraceae bacterium]|tara:strand:+ start:175843 stop:176163 length:321 start_codon:yes stop_codon:yes gene_type:complete
MKFRHAMLVTFLLGLFAFSAHSEEYKAPKLQFKSNHNSKKYDVAKEKDFREFEENSYRVQESDYSDRNLASEVEPMDADDAEGRNPSSQKEEPAPEMQPKTWKYNR